MRAKPKVLFVYRESTKTGSTKIILLLIASNISITQGVTKAWALEDDFGIFNRRFRKNENWKVIQLKLKIMFEAYWILLNSLTDI